MIVNRVQQRIEITFWSFAIQLMENSPAAGDLLRQVYRLYRKARGVLLRLHGQVAALRSIPLSRYLLFCVLALSGLVLGFFAGLAVVVGFNVL